MASSCQSSENRFQFELIRLIRGSYVTSGGVISPLKSNDRFIQLQAVPYVTETPDTQMKTGINILEEYKNPLESSLSIPTGSKSFVWKSPWAVFHHKNKPAVDIITQRFVEKYKDSIVYHNYEDNGYHYLFVIFKFVIPQFISIITDQSIVQKDFINIDNLYIGVVYDIPMNRISNSGNISHHILLPEELKQYKSDIITSTSKITSNISKIYDNISFNEEKTRGTLTFTKRQNGLLITLLTNESQILQEDLVEYELLCYEFKKFQKQGIKADLLFGKKEWNINDIVVKLEELCNISK